MKKIFAILLIAILAITIFGCNDKKEIATEITETTATETATETIAAIPAENMSVTFSQGKIEISKDNVIHLSVVNPEDGDQEQVPHPHIYAQTNKSATPITFVLDVPEGYVGIVFGFNVDGISNGVYEAIGPGSYKRIITDGAGLIIRNKWAQSEFKFRLDEAKKYNWAYGTIDYGPLAAKPTETQAAPAPTTKVRVVTGTTGEWKSFSVGDSVVGSVIIINGFPPFNTDPKGYYITEAMAPGKVQYGVVNFWKNEVKDQTLITPDMYGK